MIMMMMTLSKKFTCTSRVAGKRVIDDDDGLIQEIRNVLYPELQAKTTEDSGKATQDEDLKEMPDNPEFEVDGSEEDNRQAIKEGDSKT